LPGKRPHGGFPEITRAAMSSSSASLMRTRHVCPTELGYTEHTSWLLLGLAEKGYRYDQLLEMQKIIDAERSYIFDMLAHVTYALPPLRREERVAREQVLSEINSPRSSGLSCLRLWRLCENTGECIRMTLR
jgi:hypothetical protein